MRPSDRALHVDNARSIARQIRERVPDGNYCRALLATVETAWATRVPSVDVVTATFPDDPLGASLVMEADRLLGLLKNAEDDAPALLDDVMAAIREELNPPTPA